MPTGAGVLDMAGPGWLSGACPVEEERAAPGTETLRGTLQLWSPERPRCAGAPISYAAGRFALLMGLWIIPICNSVKRKNNNSEFFFRPCG